MQFAEFVEKEGKSLAFARGEHLFRQGDSDGSVYVLIEGLLKAYYLSPEGRETVKSFILPGELIGSLASAWRKEACSFSLVCLQASAVVQLDFDAILARTRSDLEMADAMVGHLLEFSMRKERREREFLTESAEERYRLLLERSPGLHGQVAQKEIARYLGITPVALSRIRKRISNTD